MSLASNLSTFATRVATEFKAVRTEIALKANTSSLAQVATTGNAAHLTGTLSTAQLPPLAISDVTVVANQAAMLALTAQRGDVAIRTDNSTAYILSTDSPGTLADWKSLGSPGAVLSVAGKTGTVTLVKADVGLDQVDNTSDANKPISSATATALSGKAPTAHNHDTLYYTKAEIGDPEQNLVTVFNAGLV